MFNKPQVVIDLEEYNELLKIKEEKEKQVNPEKQELNHLKQAIGEALYQSSAQFNKVGTVNEFTTTLKQKLYSRGYAMFIKANHVSDGSLAASRNFKETIEFNISKVNGTGL